MKHRIIKRISQGEVKSALQQLLLSYDIVKAHCGELKVETKEGSELIILLPLA